MARAAEVISGPGSWFTLKQMLGAPGSQRLRAMEDSIQQYGQTVRFHLGPLDFYVSGDPAVARHVLVEHPQRYVKSDRYDSLKFLLGQGLVTSEGALWKRQRKLTQPAFHKPKLAALASMMTAAGDEMLNSWAARGDVPIALHSEMMKVTLNIVGRALFGTDLNAFSQRFAEHLETLLPYIDKRSMAIASIPDWVPTPDNLKARRARQGIYDIVDTIINQRRQAGGEGDDLLGMLLGARDEDTGQGMDDAQLRDEVVTLVSAGHETTANALSWTFHLLAQNPEAERKMHAEVSSVLEGRAPTMADLPRLSYTSQVLQESMRIFPPVWILDRFSLEDDTIGDVQFPKGSRIAVFVYHLHHNPQHWPNPEKFDPERFTPENVAARHRGAYLPFGAGPRQCLGNHFAMMEGVLLLAQIAQRYRVVPLPGQPVIELEPTVTLRPSVDFKVRLLPSNPVSARAAAS